MDHTKQPLNRKRSAAFTLVELVVVITILAILGTIGFLSVGGYSSRARDSQRLVDVENISKSLDFAVISIGSYPAPDNSFTVTYSGANLWQQGIVGSSVLQAFRSSISGGGLNKKPIDPLDGSDYSYSVLSQGKAYQVMADYEGDLSAFGAPSVVESAYAAPGAPTIAYVRGNYAGLVAKTSTWNLVYVLAVPSIVTNTGSVGMQIPIASLSGSLVFNGKNFKNASTYNPGSATAIVFSWSKLLDNTTDVTTFVNNLKNAYSGATDLAGIYAVSNLLSVTGATNIATFGSTVISAQLGGGNVGNTPEIPLYTFTTHTFTSCGTSGVSGPALSTCVSSYNGTEVNAWKSSYLSMTVNGIQEWTVPATGTYRIIASGAQGGNAGTYVGWYGATLQWDISLSKGDKLKILVGQTGNWSYGGGGGGTFVTKSDNTPLIVAGGGGTNSPWCSTAPVAVLTTSGGGWTNGTGGSSGGGGSGSNGSPGGAGLIGNGTASSCQTSTPQSFVNGWVGSSSAGGGRWGFWGGSATDDQCQGQSGPGGGYSGGGASSSSSVCGGGGGSYNAGTNQSSSVANTGNGSVAITKL